MHEIAFQSEMILFYILKDIKAIFSLAFESILRHMKKREKLYIFFYLGSKGKNTFIETFPSSKIFSQKIFECKLITAFTLHPHFLPLKVLPQVIDFLMATKRVGGPIKGRNMILPAADLC